MLRGTTVTVALLVAALAPPPAEAAEAAELKLEIVPSEITVALDKATSVLVVARNAGPVATDVTLSWLDAPRLEIASKEPLRSGPLAQTAERVWELSVGRQPETAAQKLLFRVDYVAGGVSRVATGVLDVAISTAAKLEDVATVEVKTTLDSLDEHHSGVVYLVVANKLTTSLTVEEVTATGPDSVRFVGPEAAVTIAARQSTAIDVAVQAEERVRPGKHLLLFDLRLSWGDGQEARVITTHQAQIGIAGESVVLTALGVPTFLLLPGFLLMVALATWWRFGVLRPGGRPQEAPFEIAKPDFWALAVTASIAIAVAYPRLGGVDYLRGAYGLRDVVLIWVASLLLGTAIWFVGVGFWWLWRSWTHWRTPTVDDDAATVLRRLGRQRLPLNRPRYVFGTGGVSYTGYVLQRRRDAANVWLAPRIAVSVRDGVGDGAALLERLQNEKKPRKLAKILEQRRADLELAWDSGGGAARPYVKTASDIAAATEQAPAAVLRAA